MSEDHTYNGWTNYETWLVHLWLDNSQAELAEYRERLENRAPGPFDMVSASPQMVLKDYVKELTHVQETGLAADLITTALGSVNWREIADHLAERLG